MASRCGVHTCDGQTESLYSTILHFIAGWTLITNGLARWQHDTRVVAFGWKAVLFLGVRAAAVNYRRGFTERLQLSNWRLCVVKCSTVVCVVPATVWIVEGHLFPLRAHQRTHTTRHWCRRVNVQLRNRTHLLQGLVIAITLYSSVSC